jgi:hypothetical protein
MAKMRAVQVARAGRCELPYGADDAVAVIAANFLGGELSGAREIS